MDQAQALSEAFLTHPVRVFLEACLWEKGIKSVDDKVREDMVQDLAPRLQDWLWQAVFSRLKQEDLPDWKLLMEAGPEPTDIWDFFREKIPNVDKVMEEAMAEFKKIYVGA